MDDNKAKALAAALAQIEKQFGKGSIMRLGDGEVVSDIQAISTGIGSGKVDRTALAQLAATRS